MGETMRALEREDVCALRELFGQSQDSLRDDYEVSVPEIDALIETSRSCPGLVCARMTGGGFGGAVVGLARRGTGARVGLELVERYNRTAAQPATLVLPA